MSSMELVKDMQAKFQEESASISVGLMQPLNQISQKYSASSQMVNHKWLFWTQVKERDS